MALIVQKYGGTSVGSADRIRAAEWILRAGIGSELVHQALAIPLALALYRLFRPVDESLARERRGLPDKVPSLLMVDADNVLQKVIVDERLIREAIARLALEPELVLAFSDMQADITR